MLRISDTMNAVWKVIWVASRIKVATLEEHPLMPSERRCARLDVAAQLISLGSGEMEHEVSRKVPAATGELYSSLDIHL